MVFAKKLCSFLVRKEGNIPFLKCLNIFVPDRTFKKQFLEWRATVTCNFAIKDNTLASLCSENEPEPCFAQQNNTVTSIIRLSFEGS